MYIPFEGKELNILREIWNHTNHFNCYLKTQIWCNNSDEELVKDLVGYANFSMLEFDWMFVWGVFNPIRF